MGERYSGVWRAGNDDYFLWANAQWPSFQDRWKQLSEQNLRLEDLSVLTTAGGRFFTGAWRTGTDDHFLFVDANWEDFFRKHGELLELGLRLKCIATYVKAGQRVWAGVWREGTDRHFVWADANWESFWNKHNELAQLGLGLADFCCYRTSAGPRWAATWQESDRAQFVWANANWDSFYGKWQELVDKGMRLVRLRSHEGLGQMLYSGLWEPGDDDHYLFTDSSWTRFEAKWKELAEAGLRVVSLNVRPAYPMVRLHFKILSSPRESIETQLACMRKVYGTAGIHVQVGSSEELKAPALDDLDVGTCTTGRTTAEQNDLFQRRNHMGARDILVGFVRSTVPVFSGCAAHPAGRPGVAVASEATKWTLAHEVGHVLGLAHINNSDRLMTGIGTSRITNEPPDLTPGEVQRMKSSSWIQMG